MICMTNIRGKHERSCVILKIHADLKPLLVKAFGSSQPNIRGGGDDVTSEALAIKFLKFASHFMLCGG